MTVNLATGTATAVASGVSGIENVTGGSGADSLTGDDVSGDAGANVMVGGRRQRHAGR